MQESDSVCVRVSFDAESSRYRLAGAYYSATTSVLTESNTGSAYSCERMNGKRETQSAAGLSDKDGEKARIKTSQLNF